MNYLSVSNLSKSFNEKTLFEDLTFGIQQGEMEIMSTVLLDERKYRELLQEALPVVIRTGKEYQRLLWSRYSMFRWIFSYSS